MTRTARKIASPKSVQRKSVDRSQLFAGNLEQVGAEGISGWLLRLKQPMSRTLVVAHIGEILLASKYTDIVRKDVNATLIDHAFRGPLPTGFNLLPHADALAALQDMGRSAKRLPLTVSVFSGPDIYQFKHKVAARPASKWLELLSKDKIDPDTMPQISPGWHDGMWYGSMADFELYPLGDDIDALAAAPGFEAATYAEAVERQAPALAAIGLRGASPAGLLSHFCLLGHAAGLRPHPAYALDPDCIKTRFPGSALPILDFFRSWLTDRPVAPSAEIAAEAADMCARLRHRDETFTRADELRVWAISVGLLPDTDGTVAPLLQELKAIERAEDLAKLPPARIVSIGAPELTEDAIMIAAATLRDSGAFDTEYYLSTNPDVAAAGVDPIDHYVRYGEREGRNPSPGFDAQFYLTSNADVCALAPNAFAHFIAFGRGEGRLSLPPSKADDRLGDPILLVGHSAMLAGAERILLDLTKWIAQHTKRPLTVYLMKGGALTAEFCRYAEVIAAPPDPVLDLALRINIMRRSWGAVYLNTVVAGGFLQGLGPDILRNHTMIGHIHEMKNVLEEHDDALRFLKENCSHIISASPNSTASLAEDFGVDPERITTLPAFIDPVVSPGEEAARMRAWARAELGLGPDDKVVMGCGSVYWRKGPDIFVETALAANADRPDDDPIHFVWVGDGEDRAALEEQTAAVAQSDRIRFTGMRTDAAAMLAASDLFLLSSREDPFPLVCMEAAQHAVPTLYVAGTTGIGRFVHPPETMGHGQPGGWELGSSAPREIAKVVTEAFEDPKEIAARGTAAQERLWAYYTSATNCRLIFSKILDLADLAPVVSVVVPNYNHAAFLPERLRSIVNQTMKDIEIIVLDDCSTDDSLEVITAELDGLPNARIVPGETNSGGVFRQWKKGLAIARGLYTWIAESDDWCNEVFLEKLCDRLTDPGVVIATGRTTPYFEGSFDPEPMQNYLNSQCPGMFDHPFDLDGDVFVNRGMGAACLLVNASGILMRTDMVRVFVDKGLEYRMAGDWVIYLHILRHGRIVYAPEAENYFRRHAGSTVHEIEGTALYFDERKRIANLVYDLFSVGTGLHGRIRSTLQHEVDRFQHKSPGITLNDVAPDRVPTLRPRAKVAFYVHGMTFSKGGIERLAAQLANHLASVGFEVHILCRHWGTQSPVYPLHSAVRLTQAFSEDWLDASIRDVHAYLVNHGIETFVPMLSEWLFKPLVEAGRRAGVRIVASEHNDPWQIEEKWWDHEERQAVFGQADEIHLLSHSFVPSLEQGLRDRAVVIPNGVDMDIYRPPGETAAQYRGLRRIVAAGRLVPQKRMDVLIAAFIEAGLGEKGWQLDIYGHGADETELAQQIAAGNADDHITLRGVSDQMVKVFQDADIAVLPSDFEGFGIVAVEAMACGTPVMAFADCNGPNEIIEDGRSGILVQVPKGSSRASALAAALDEIAESPETLRSLSEHTRARAETFSLQTFLRGWEMLLDGDTQRGGAH